MDRRLPLLRDEAGLSQAEAAKLCGVTQATYSRWETGKVAPGIRSISLYLRAVWIIRTDAVRRIGSGWRDAWLRNGAAYQVEQVEQAKHGHVRT